MPVRRKVQRGIVAMLLSVAVAQAGPFVIKLEVPAPQDSAGYGGDGKKLWVLKEDIVVGGSSEGEGLPGHCGPGVAAGDVDDDGKCEVVFITKDSVIHVVEGAAGREKAKAAPPVPNGAQRWELAMIADFRGSGKDLDILLKATNKDGYRMGKFLAAYTMKALLAGGKPLWETDEFVSCAHNGARLADLNGDGRDEVLGETIFSPDGKLATRAIPDRYHIDSVFVADVQPERAGLEVVLLE